MSPPIPLLQCRNLRVQLPTAQGWRPAVRGLDLTLQAGQTVGLIGESGSGKSITALALMGLQPEAAQVSGSLQFKGQELLGQRDGAWQAIRGNRMAMIFQEPMTALNPAHRVGHQVAEPMRLHLGLPRAEALQRAVALLHRVGIPDAARRAAHYPHQFSGGQRQRIMIAMALACGPDVLIADEPTTALDVSVQQHILTLVADLVAERGMALLLISHDLGLIARNVQRLLVMYGGSVVESGPAADVLAHPLHPYTRGLMAARPSLAHRLVAHRSERLPTIAGNVPGLAHLPPGCPFAGRCALTSTTQPDCAQQTPPWHTHTPGHGLRCLRAAESIAHMQPACLSSAPHAQP